MITRHHDDCSDDCLAKQIERALDAHASSCDGPDDWHHSITGHCGGCDCFTCAQER